MAISASSIIHYTKSFSDLEKIISEGFKIKYCVERLYTNEDRGSLAAHPMVSFCDIPLSHANKHFESYGHYGIGLTKNWAKRNGLNPVIYIDKSSSLTQTIISLIEERRNANSNLTEEQKSLILKIKAFTKNYSGELFRGNVKIENYKFYDEREWRFVPEKEDIGGRPISIPLSKYEKDKAGFNNKINDYRLLFRADDISYIIVEKRSEIPRIIKHMRSIYSDDCTVNELDVLFTKICTIRQIEEDY